MNIYNTVLLNLSLVKYVSERVVENQNRIFMTNGFFFSEIVPFIMWKYMVLPFTPQTEMQYGAWSLHAG